MAQLKTCPGRVSCSDGESSRLISSLLPKIIILDHDKYAGQEFTKQNVQVAFQIQHSVTSTNSQLFGSAALADAPDALDWVNNLNGSQKQKFAKMTISQFKASVADAKQRTQRKLKHWAHAILL